jgi:hypothetical protein
VIDEAELRAMSPHERMRLQRALAALDTRRPAPGPGSDRRRAVVLAVIIACCVGLAIWTGVLAVTLPRFYHTGGWRGAWVGFDIALLVTFAATGWAAWRRRQVLIICLVVLATLLCCDAWFDVVLDAHTKGFWLSLLTALIVELPLAASAIIGARRLLRLTIGMVSLREGYPGPVPPLRKIPLFGPSPPENLRDLLGQLTREPHLPAPPAGQGPGERHGPGDGQMSADRQRSAGELG